MTNGWQMAATSFSSRITFVSTNLAIEYQSYWYEGHITDEHQIDCHMARLLGVPDDYDLFCFLPVGISKSTPTSPRKKAFENYRPLS